MDAPDLTETTPFPVQIVTVFFIFALSLAVGTAVRGLNRRWAAPVPLSEPQKIPFFGGAAPSVHAWSRYHLRYYSMTLLFIAFEMEMMFMYPWAVVYLQEGAKALAEMGMFLGILSVGIFYGWREGIFRWQ